MATYLVMLGALALIPVLAILLLKVNGAIAFMSLCLGSVLVRYTSHDVTGVLSSMSASKGISMAGQWAQLTLLLVPLLLTVLFTRGNVKGAKSITNILPALATGLLCVLLAVPLLGTNTAGHIYALTAWRQLSNAETGVILGGALFSLAFLLFTHRKRKSGDEEGKKKKGKHKE